MSNDSTVKKDVNKKAISAPSGNTELSYNPADDVDPLELIGNAHLALHHHMAPADGSFDIDGDE